MKELVAAVLLVGIAFASFLLGAVLLIDAVPERVEIEELISD